MCKLKLTIKKNAAHMLYTQRNRLILRYHANVFMYYSHFTSRLIELFADPNLLVA